MTRLVTAVALGLIIGALAAVVFGAGPWSSERTPVPVIDLEVPAGDEPTTDAPATTEAPSGTPAPEIVPPPTVTPAPPPADDDADDVDDADDDADDADDADDGGGGDD